MNADLSHLLRRADRIGRNQRDGYLAGRDLWKLIASVAGEPRCRDREEREELFSRLAVVAASWLDANPRRYRASDREALREALRAAAEPELARFRRERGAELPADLAAAIGSGSGLDDVIAHAEQSAKRAAATTAKRTGRDWLAAGDPAEPGWLRDTVASFPADIASVVLTGWHPEALQDEWAAAEGCKLASWRSRLQRGRSRLRSNPAAIEWIAAAMRRAEPREHDPVAALRRVMEAGTPIRKPVPRPDGLRDHCDRQAPVATSTVTVPIAPWPPKPVWADSIGNLSRLVPPGCSGPHLTRSAGTY